MKCQAECFYIEFNPLDVVDIIDLIDKAQSMCKAEHGIHFDQYDFKVGRLHNNAELHYLKAIIYLPIGHENRNFLLS